MVIKSTFVYFRTIFFQRKINIFLIKDEWQLDQQRVEFIINKDDHSALLAGNNSKYLFKFISFENFLVSSVIEMDTFFRDIESIKSSRFSVAEPDVPTGLYLQDYDQYLTNDQKRFSFIILFPAI